MLYLSSERWKPLKISKELRLAKSSQDIIDQVLADVNPTKKFWFLSKCHYNYENLKNPNNTQYILLKFFLSFKIQIAYWIITKIMKSPSKHWQNSLKLTKKIVDQTAKCLRMWFQDSTVPGSCWLAFVWWFIVHFLFITSCSSWS